MDEQSKLNDDSFFRNYLNNSLEKLSMTDEACASLVDISVPSVRCWRLGVTAPHLVLRKLVYRELEKKLSEFEERSNH